MAAGVFNVSKGKVAEKCADATTSLGILLLKVAAAEATLKNYATVGAITADSANNTEANFTNYARKTGLTATITSDTANNRVYVDCADQTWSSAGGASNNSIVRAIFFLDEGGTDATRIPLVYDDFVTTTDGTDLLYTIGSPGFFVAS